MPNSLVLGLRPISIEDVEDVARREARVEFAEPARSRIRQGRVKLEERLAAGDRIYGVNTGVGGNIKFALDAEQTERFQHNLMNHLSCGTGAPLPRDVVRAAMLLRLATFSRGAGAIPYPARPREIGGAPGRGRPDLRRQYRRGRQHQIRARCRTDRTLPAQPDESSLLRHRRALAAGRGAGAP